VYSSSPSFRDEHRRPWLRRNVTLHSRYFWVNQKQVRMMVLSDQSEPDFVPEGRVSEVGRRLLYVNCSF
jgi:hypothetical protein